MLQTCTTSALPFHSCQMSLLSEGVQRNTIRKYLETTRYCRGERFNWRAGGLIEILQFNSASSSSSYAQLQRVFYFWDHLHLLHPFRPFLLMAMKLFVMLYLGNTESWYHRHHHHHHYRHYHHHLNALSESSCGCVMPSHAAQNNDIKWGDSAGQGSFHARICSEDKPVAAACNAPDTQQMAVLRWSWDHCDI